MAGYRRPVTEAERAAAAETRQATLDHLHAQLSEGILALHDPKAAMLPPPPTVLHVGWRHQIRLGRDYYVRVDTNDYSVDPSAIGRTVDVSADLEHVRVTLAGRLVAEHDRVWARRRTITDPAHVTGAARLRHAFQQPRPRGEAEGMMRDLADYDRAFGLDQRVGA
jgi:hypothetical protein